MADLKQEFERYLAKKAEYLALYRDKFIVLKDGEVHGVYDDAGTAAREGSKKFTLGTFLVQQVTEFDDQVRFHSRHA